MPPLRVRMPRWRPTSVLRAALLGVAVARIARRPEPVSPTAVDPTDVTVVVPARDEAGRIGPCLRSVVGAATRVLVVDDGSTDETAAVARAAGAEVLDAGPLPDGWAGKARALQVGLEAATTPIVVTIDADTRAEPGFASAVAGLLGGRTLVTGATRVDAHTGGERWLHPAMLATLVYRFGRPGTPTRPARTMANGQCMVLDRARLLAGGGFTLVRDRRTEDLALARHLAEEGHAVGFVDASHLLRVEGYGGARAVWSGWGRSLDLAEVTPPADQALDLAVLWAAVALPLPRLLAGRGDLIDLAAVVLRAGVTVGIRPAYVRGGLPHTLSPLADLAVAGRITWGTFRPDRTWRGRTYS